MSVLHDVFISHASEDKDAFVRSLAQRLREAHIEVWYDEFSLNVGDSLRRSIDHGLAQSRFGIVVLSQSFFGKQWSQWELDGLVARQNSGAVDVLLPIWHGIGRDDVMAYSPPLADRVALPTSLGLDEIVRRLVSVIRPRGSTLVYARDYLIEMGTTPPVISDDWWLDVAATAESNQMEGNFQEAMGWGRWGFPLPPAASDSEGRGLRLAWAALQMAWQREAEQRPITQITRPELLHDFIASQPGLLATCQDYLPYLIAYAPQIVVPGCGGPFEEAIEVAYQRAVANGKCDEEFALRAPDFAGCGPSYVACHFIQGDTVGFGPPVQFYEPIDYAAWLLSDESEWLPSEIRAFLTRGMAEWPVWPWHRGDRAATEDLGFEPAPQTGKLLDALYRARTRQTFRLSKDATRDLVHRLGFSASMLRLPEKGDLLADRFLEAGFIDGFYADRRKR